MAIKELSIRAQAVADAIRAGDVDEANRRLIEFRESLSGKLAGDDAKAAAAIILEARKLAVVYRAQTIRALQSVVRQQLYQAPRAEGRTTFQIEG